MGNKADLDSLSREEAIEMCKKTNEAECRSGKKLQHLFGTAEKEQTEDVRQIYRKELSDTAG